LAERGAAPKNQAGAPDDLAALDRSYDWLPHFDEAKVVCRSHRISILREE
jgi:hypothetical protein